MPIEEVANLVRSHWLWRRVAYKDGVIPPVHVHVVDGVPVETGRLNDESVWSIFLLNALLSVSLQNQFSDNIICNFGGVSFHQSFQTYWNARPLCHFNRYPNCRGAVSSRDACGILSWHNCCHSEALGFKFWQVMKFKQQNYLRQLFETCQKQEQHDQADLLVRSWLWSWFAALYIERQVVWQILHTGSVE